MKSLLALVVALFALSAFAQGVPTPVAPAKKEEAKPAATAPAKVVAPAKSEAKTAPAKEAKAAK